MGPSAELDHLVIAADTLYQGVRYVQDCLGVPMTGGGKHAVTGTHNRVIKMGYNRYLEVIAIDPEGRQPDFPRWFNLDDPEFQARLRIRPQLITWVVRSDHIDALAEMTYGQRVCVRTMQRDALRWRFAFTEDGSMPGAGLIPHMMQWVGSGHPAETMPDSGCTLIGLDGVHADPQSVQRAIFSMGLDKCITIHPVSEQRPQGLFARIKTPTGTVIIDTHSGNQPN